MRPRTARHCRSGALVRAARPSEITGPWRRRKRGLLPCHDDDHPAGPVDQAHLDQAGFPADIPGRCDRPDIRLAASRRSPTSREPDRSIARVAFMPSSSARRASSTPAAGSGSSRNVFSHLKTPGPAKAGTSESCLPPSLPT